MQNLPPYPYAYPYAYTWQQPTPTSQLQTPSISYTGAALQPTAVAQTPWSSTSTQTAVAYTSVQTKPKVLQEAEGKPATQSKDTSWPDSLRKYVERAFALSQTSKNRAKVQQSLKKVIEDAQKRGELWTKDWANMPLPVLGDSSKEEVKETNARVVFQIPSRPIFEDKSRQKKRVRPSSYSPSPSPSPPKRSEKPLVQEKKQERRRGKKSKGQNHKREANSFAAITALQDQRLEMARAARFGDGSAAGAARRAENRVAAGAGASLGFDTESDGGYEVVKGSMTQLEKSYFRLTSKPDASSVRPEEVLRQALKRLVGLLKQGRVNYIYAADQFKGMRQDCTVQHLRNSLSVSVYEAHARSALEHGDLAEFNQCQGQLMQHYEAGVPGCSQEFKAYRILYQAVHVGKGNRIGLLSSLQGTSQEDALCPPVRHALQVRQALAAGDSTLVCRLYQSAPNMGQALLDVILPKVRFLGLKVFAKAYLPNLPVATIAVRLGFVSPADFPPAPAPAPPLPGCTKDAFAGSFVPEVDESAGLKLCKSWLRSHGAVLVPGSGASAQLAMDCKASAKQLHLPESTAQTKLGPDLAIDDFLTRSCFL